MKKQSKLFVALLMSTSLVLSGCGTLTPIPGHGGGKRFSVEQRLVAASIRAALRGIDVSVLRGERVAIVYDLISDEGGGNLSGGRFSLGGAVKLGSVASPVTSTLSQFQVFDLVGSQVNSNNVNSSSAGNQTATTSNVVNSVVNSSGSQTTPQTTVTSVVNNPQTTTTNTIQNPETTTTVVNGGNTTTVDNPQTITTNTTNNPETTTTVVNGASTTTTNNPQVTTTQQNGAVTTTVENPATSGTQTTQGNQSTTETVTGGTTTNQTINNPTTTTNTGTTATTGTQTTGASTNTQTTDPNTVTQNNSGSTNTQTTAANTQTQTSVTDPNTVTQTNSGSTNTQTTAPNTQTQTSVTDANTTNSSQTTPETTVTSQGNETGNSTENGNQNVDTTETANTNSNGTVNTRSQTVAGPVKTTTQRSGTDRSAEVTLQYKGLGDYQVLGIPKSDASFLMGQVRNYLLLNGVQVTVPQDPTATVLLYVSVDIFGINRQRFDAYAYNRESLTAETGFEMFAFDRSGKMIMAPRSSVYEAKYDENYLFWAGPFRSDYSVRPGEPLEVDFSDVDGTQPLYPSEKSRYDDLPPLVQ